ncbi:MAG TPA: kynureninase [Gemmataceae bacterium]|nr:kynureninase [Gemmataceae bacterium]
MSPDESYALEQDAADPLAAYRDRFHLPRRPDGSSVIYFCGNSLGLQPKSTRAIIERELDDWARLGVSGHFKEECPWYSYHELFRESGARLVGALPGEVVMMNSLTVNLHLMMVTFYRPTRERHKILIDEPAFPSDLYAVQSQVRHHGYEPEQAIVAIGPRPGEQTIRIEDVVELLERRGPEIALVWWNGVNFYSGEYHDLARIASASRRHGCVVGLDLAHAAGNVPLSLHDWQADFAVWCNYKYVNAGPGAVAGCFVHERHGLDTDLPRFAGWWGNDPATRFRMHLEPRFVPRAGADGWQVSNPPILAMAPLRASLDLFDHAGMAALRKKSERLTSYLEYLLDQIPGRRFDQITPREPARRGCQLSIRLKQGAPAALAALEAAGVVCDFREPDVIRAAPTPLYSTFHEVWTFARILAANLG